MFFSITALRVQFATMICKIKVKKINAAVQSQTVVIAYQKSIQLLLFTFT